MSQTMPNGTELIVATISKTGTSTQELAVIDYYCPSEKGLILGMRKSDGSRLLLNFDQRLVSFIKSTQ